MDYKNGKTYSAGFVNDVQKGILHRFCGCLFLALNIESANPITAHA